MPSPFSIDPLKPGLFYQNLHTQIINWIIKSLIHWKHMFNKPSFPNCNFERRFISPHLSSVMCHMSQTVKLVGGRYFINGATLSSFHQNGNIFCLLPINHFELKTSKYAWVALKIYMAKFTLYMCSTEKTLLGKRFATYRHICTSFIVFSIQLEEKMYFFSYIVYF